MFQFFHSHAAPIWVPSLLFWYINESLRHRKYAENLWKNREKKDCLVTDWLRTGSYNKRNIEQKIPNRLIGNLVNCSTKHKTCIRFQFDYDKFIKAFIARPNQNIRIIEYLTLWISDVYSRFSCDIWQIVAFFYFNKLKNTTSDHKHVDIVFKLHSSKI